MQRDALECLYKLIDILHKGTKHSIVDFDFSPVDDEFITSLAKTLFNATIKKVLKCGVCHTENISEFTTNLINVYPVIGKSLSEILDDSFKSQVTKICSSCSVDTLHNELSRIEHHSNILVIAINRFHFGISARKNNTGVLLNRHICHNSIFYDLIGSVHHHGSSTSSGHYTSKVYFTNVVYLCNDQSVSKFKYTEEISDSAYIVFYRPRDQL